MGLHRRRGWSVGKSIVVRSLTVQSVEEIMTSQRIPNTDSIEELARFWDTHDLPDFQAELQEVRTPIFLSRSSIPRICSSNQPHCLHKRLFIQIQHFDECRPASEREAITPKFGSANTGVIEEMELQAGSW